MHIYECFVHNIYSIAIYHETLYILLLISNIPIESILLLSVPLCCIVVLLEGM